MFVSFNRLQYMIYLVIFGIAGRPNILFIVLDDFRPIMKSYGNQLIIAPNMDNLARNSVVFNRAYTQVDFTLKFS